MLATYTAILWICIASLIKKLERNNSYYLAFDFCISFTKSCNEYIEHFVMFLLAVSQCDSCLVCIVMIIACCLAVCQITL